MTTIAPNDPYDPALKRPAPTGGTFGPGPVPPGGDGKMMSTGGGGPMDYSTVAAPAPAAGGLPPGAKMAPDGRMVILANGQMVDKNHKLYAEAMAAGQPAPAATPGAPGAAGANTIPGQAGAASTYSTTPGAAPLDHTTNQGTQDVVRNSYLEQATQPKTIDANNPNVKLQSDAFRANAERAARNYSADQAEKLGPYATGALQGQERMAMEHAGQASGSFEAQLVGKELDNRRTEIQNALQNLGGMISDDQKLAMTKELAQLQDQTQRLGITTGAQTADKEIALKDKLGTGGLNVDMMGLLQNQDQFGKTLGFNIGDREAYWNNAALQNML